jgi:hypothetical protein
MSESVPITTPRKLYKYRSLTSDVDRDRVKDILLNNRLYFPTRLEFNDPFDCRIPIIWTGYSENEWRQKLMEVYQTSPPLPMAFLGRTEEFVDEHLKMGAIASLEQEGERATEESMNQFRILCLCECPKNILMWSHYAGCHGGICLEFEVRDHSYFSSAVPVEYPPQYPLLKATLPVKELATGLIRTKAESWAYEKEWRIFSIHSADSYIFPTECLSGVVLGCQIKPEHEALIKEWLASRNSPVTLHMAIKSKDKFALEIQKVEKIGPLVL